MRSLYLFAFLLLTNIALTQTQQEPIYINFYDDYVSYTLEDSTTDTLCKSWSYDTSKDFTSSFVYQLKQKGRLTGVTDLQSTGVDCVSFKVKSEDSICYSGDGVRAEVRLKWDNMPLSTSNTSYYKIKFFIPNDFRISGYNDQHNIFQIKSDEDAQDGDWLQLPQFLLQLKHDEGFDPPSVDIPYLQLNYGLEFKYLVNGEDCERAPIDEITGQVDPNDVVDPSCGELSSRQKISVAAQYGWNTMTFHIKWSNSCNGWMDAYLNGVQVPGGLTHTFNGRNMYNTSMFPGSSVPSSSDFDLRNYIKMGQYRFGSNLTKKIYYEYFYADNTLANIEDNFKTFIENDDAGLMDMREDIKFHEIIGADEYVLSLDDGSGNQYIGNASKTLTFDDLLGSSLNLDFYTDYTTNVRAKYNVKGFEGKYSDTKTVRFEPNTGLKGAYCDNYCILTTDELRLKKIRGADGYVLYITKPGDPSFQEYHGVPANARIDVQTLFNNLNLSTGERYLINARAKFDQYGMQGQYSNAPCEVEFVSAPCTAPSSPPVSVFPNPFHNLLQIEVEQGTNYQIEVFSFSGERLINKEDAASIQLDVASLKPGYYFVRITTESGVETKQIVKR